MEKTTNNLKKIRILPESTPAAIGLLALFLGEVVFLFFVLALDVLPFTYIILVIAVLLAIDVGIWLLLRTKRRNTVKRVIGLILALIVMNTLLMGDYYVYSTYDTLQKISRQRASWEYYNVVVLKEGSYQTVSDIRDHTVTVPAMESKQLNEAKERLVTKENVSYKEKDLLAAGHSLVDENGESHDNIALIPKDSYKLLRENIKGMRANTKSIYTIKVRKRANDNSSKVDVVKDSYNILISGLDSWGKIESGGLSDVNMVMTVNPQTREVLLTSIPRDSYVPLHSYGARDKLTHTGLYGEEETKQTIEDMLGIEINYAIRVNFSTLCDIINAIGGIDVYSDYTFGSAITDWEYKEGWNHMSGKKALYFARERKSFLEGDMQRNKNQQKVLEATLKRITSSKVLMTRYTKILDSVEDEMWTDFSNKDLKRLAKMQLRSMKKWNIEKVNISGPTGSAPCYSMGGQMLSVVYPDQETVDNAKKKIHDVMYPVDNSVPTEQKSSDSDKSKGSSQSKSSD